jgi:hypothetical protein
MIKIKCSVRGNDSCYKSSSFDIMRLRAGEIVPLQCGDEVRLMGQILKQEDPGYHLEVFAAGKD